MLYNFDKEINRRGTNSVKWDSRNDVPEDIIPMWVADMDFETAPAILKALERRVHHGVFGYTHVPEAYYDAIVNWFSRWHGWTIDRDMVIYTSGVVPAISAIIKALTRPGDCVLIMTPVYNCFFTSIRNQGCHALESPMIYENESYSIDYTDLEAKAADPKCRILLLCNPHNPAGRVWTREELVKVRDIAQRNNVLVVSDEIHCELVYPGYEYVPYATLGAERWVACVSPSKAFNIAGLQIANIVTSDAELRAKIDRAINDNEVCDVNPFGVVGLIAAYNESRPWLEQLILYLYDNYKMLKEMLTEQAPQFTLTKLEGTYLAWLDVRRLGIPTDELEEILIREAHVWINAGSMYGRDGEGFIRINLACPRHRLKVGIDRLIRALKALDY